MQCYDDNSEPLQNFVTDVQEYEPFGSFNIHLKKQISTRESTGFHPVSRVIVASSLTTPTDFLSKRISVLGIGGPATDASAK